MLWQKTTYSMPIVQIHRGIGRKCGKFDLVEIGNMEKISERLSIFAAIFTTLSLSTSPHPFILVLCYIIHEAGHIVFARIVGAKIKKFKIGSFHLSLSYDCSNLSYKKEILVQNPKGFDKKNIKTGFILGALSRGEIKANDFKNLVINKGNISEKTYNVTKAQLIKDGLIKNYQRDNSYYWNLNTNNDW